MVCLAMQEGRWETGMFVRLFPSKCPTKRLGVTNPQLFYVLFRNPVVVTAAAPKAIAAT